MGALGPVDQGLQVGGVAHEGRLLHAHRAHDVEPGTGGGQPREGAHRAVEALVRLDEADGQEGEGVVGDAQRRPGLAPGGGGPPDEVGAVLDHLDPVRRHAEGAHQLLPLHPGVHDDPVHGPPHLAHGQPVGGMPAAPPVVDLVHPHLDLWGQPEGQGQRRGGLQALPRAGGHREEHVGVELDDDAVVAAYPLGQGQPAPRAEQVEVVVRRGRGGREHLDVVASGAQPGDRLHRVGGDPVPHRRVGGDHQDAHGTSRSVAAPASAGVRRSSAGSSRSSTASHV